MKMQRLMTIAAAGLLALSGAVLVGCQQPAATTTSTNYAGTAKAYQVVHQSGILAEAVVSTDADGNVTSAAINEWMDPKSWVYSTGANGALVGGEMIRIKMAGMNTGFSAYTDAASNAAVDGYTFFYYNANSLGWVEFAPTLTKAIPTSTTATTLPNFDLKMSALGYAKAYSDAAAAVSAAAANTDLTTVTFNDVSGNITAATTVTVSTVNAATQIAQRASKSTTVDPTKGGALNKSDPKAVYFAMNSAASNSAGKLGYRANLNALIKFFKANPTAAYSAAVKKSGQALPAATSDYKTYVADSNDLPAQSSAIVWAVSDVVTGATFSDFPNYALGLQNAYLYAIAEAKSGNLRTVQ